MEQGVIFVFTHDSLAVGEDGSTHQPIEQLASLRAIPNLLVIRPCDANETAVAWRVAIETRHRPVALILTRQDVPTFDRTQFAAADGLRQGAYVLAEARNGNPDIILIATGSEVSLIVAACKKLTENEIQVRLVSMRAGNCLMPNLQVIGTRFFRHQRPHGLRLKRASLKAGPSMWATGAT